MRGSALEAPPIPWSLRSVAWTVAMLVAMGAEVAAQATRLDARPAADFGGAWDTTYGRMTLTQEGGAVKGAYALGEIAGTVDGDRLGFTYRESRASGEGWFEMAAGGDAFEGRWRATGQADWTPWAGKRGGAAATFTGLWRTSYGLMRLDEIGGKVRGHYQFVGTADIAGAVDGRKLAFEYSQPDGERGSGTFELSPDGRRFSGRWTSNGEGSAPKGGRWRGDRVDPRPGREWLVVLEAHWEAGLREKEYSYGAMLREFFRRTPRVEVRHRFFHDEADFRRFCEEVRFVAEPVIVYVSSHGSPDGIHVGGKTIGADVIADALRGAGDIRLLHFGACAMMQGGFAERLFERLGPQARFPISGFVNVADWAGSAVIDFLYLDLILARKLDPADAAEQVRQMMTFAREETGRGAVAPAGLRLIAPPADGPESRAR